MTMNRRRLLTLAGGLIPVGFLPNISKEGDVPGPSDADIQALYERVDGLQRQLDYKNVGDSPFQRSGNFAYGRVLDRQTGVLDVANTAAETTLYSFLMAPNTLYNNRSVRLEMYGDWLNNTAGADNMIFRLKLGATTVIQSNTIAMSNSGGATRGAWMWDILLSADNSLNAQQAVWKHQVLGFNAAVGVGSFGTSTGGTPGGILGTAAKDALQPLLIEVTVDWTSASANLSWRRQYAGLELI